MIDAVTVESVFQLAHAMKQELGCKLEAQDLGITPMHVRVVMTIHNRSLCTAQDIASLFKRDKAQITRLIKGLIDQEIVQKQPNPEDKRSQLLVLTPKGKELQKSLFEFADETQKKVSHGINTDDLGTFIKVAKQMTKNLTAK